MTDAPGFVLKEAELGSVDESRCGRFVASSNRPDRMGDIVEQNWDLGDFWKNPVFLFSHQSHMPPIGWVREFTVNNDQTKTYSRVEFLPAGTNARADELFALAKIGAIRAVSIGFIPMETEDRVSKEREWLGYRFLRSQLVELSLCTVPANADAISLARSLDKSPAFLRRYGDVQFIRSGLDRPPPARELVGNFQRRVVALGVLERMKGRYSPAVPRPESRTAT